MTRAPQALIGQHQIIHIQIDLLESDQVPFEETVDDVLIEPFLDSVQVMQCLFEHLALVTVVPRQPPAQALRS